MNNLQLDGQKNNAFLEAFESVADLGTTLTDVLIKLIQNEGEAEAVVNAAENALTDLRKGVNGLNLEESNMKQKIAHVKTPFLV